MDKCPLWMDIGSGLVVDSADENRHILMDYISETKEIVPIADNNWSITPIDGDVNVTFTTSPEAKAYIKQDSNITYTNQTDNQGIILTVIPSFLARLDMFYIDNMVWFLLLIPCFGQYSCY